jgi:CubicO group peptidase (beta-lactamase class C family)
MTYPKIIRKIADTLNVLPDKTQVSIALVNNKQVGYNGIIKQNGNIDKIDNHSSAFEIGSVTKASTGNALAQLIIEKKVDPGDPAQKFLHFPLLNSPSFTLQHLVMHTSGLQRMPHDFDTQSNFDKENPFRN